MPTLQASHETEQIYILNITEAPWLYIVHYVQFNALSACTSRSAAHSPEKSMGEELSYTFTFSIPSQYSK